MITSGAMRKGIFPLVLVLTGCLSATTPRQPVVDGVMRDGEWAGARRLALDGGGEAWLMERDGATWVALRSERRAVGSLCMSDGSTIWILHASAALGTATYEREGNGWRIGRRFEWKVREGASEQEKRDYLAANGWLANADRESTDPREYEIRLPAGVNRLAIGLLHLDEPMSVSYWPESVGDDCRSVAIGQGFLPATVTFEPETWHRLR